MTWAGTSQEHTWCQLDDVWWSECVHVCFCEAERCGQLEPSSSNLLLPVALLGLLLLLLLVFALVLLCIWRNHNSQFCHFLFLSVQLETASVMLHLLLLCRHRNQDSELQHLLENKHFSFRFQILSQTGMTDLCTSLICTQIIFFLLLKRRFDITDVLLCLKQKRGARMFLTPTSPSHRKFSLRGPQVTTATPAAPFLCCLVDLFLFFRCERGVQLLLHNQTRKRPNGSDIVTTSISQKGSFDAPHV